MTPTCSTRARPLASFAACLAAGLLTTSAYAAEGYYRDPAIHGQNVVFTAEGDLWRVAATGGVAMRLTRHPGVESQASISPDGQWIAFAASYDGAEEVYVMPMAGGQPTRLSFDHARVWVQPWSPDGKVVYATDAGHGLWNVRSLRKVDPQSGSFEDIPLADASQGVIADDGTVWFTRMGLHLSTDNAIAYKGGAAARIWRYTPGSDEAVKLEPPSASSESDPMWHAGEVVFVGNASGRPALWKMAADGSARTQLTQHAELSVSDPSEHEGRIVYQFGGDLRLYDLADGSDRRLQIDLTSDFDPRRERWIEKPLTWFEGAAIDGKGQRAVLNVRGGSAVFGPDTMRRASLPAMADTRLREAVLSHDGKRVFAVAAQGRDERIVVLNANGTGEISPLVKQSAPRWSRLFPSPDGKRLAVTDFDGKLHLIDIAAKKIKVLDQSEIGGAEPFEAVTWSTDGSLLAVARADSLQRRPQILLIDAASGRKAVVTSDKYNSYAPAFSPDGNWLYFISQRHFAAQPSAPWGDRNMGPAFPRKAKVYAIALREGLRFPFAPRDELAPAEEKSESKNGKDEGSQSGKSKPSHASQVVWEGLAGRLYDVPLAADRYQAMELDDKRLYLTTRPDEPEARGQLKTLALEPKAMPEEFAKDVVFFDLSNDGKRILLVQANDQGVTDVLLLDAAAKAPADLAKSKLATDGWRIAVTPYEEWRQQYYDAWRMHRMYAFDRNLRGVDWDGIGVRYAAWLPRLTDRHELNDLLGRMASELDILHSQVRSNDLPSDSEAPKPASLGAQWRHDANGLLIDRIYAGEAELPETLPPLARPGVDARAGDKVIEVNGRSVATPADMARALNQQAGQQVLLKLQRGAAKPHEVIVIADGADKDAAWRYADWIAQRQTIVARRAADRIGYLHLRAMGGNDIATFAREFYAQVDREGLIIDVRRNRGGNIDSWIIEKLLRRAWAFWSADKSPPYWNMQNAFRGHLVVLTDEMTYSDGETFAAGIKSLGLGTLVGKQTAGAGIWLSDRNRLSDGGIARIAEFAQHAVDGRWIIEGRGVSPDVDVDNLPHATFVGGDAQLDVAIDTLLRQIDAEPVPKLQPGPITPVGTTAGDAQRLGR